MADLDLAGRVVKLEQDNRRLKRAGVAVAALLVAVPLAGAMLPRQVPEVVTARAFRVLDEAGTVRARLDTGGLTVFDDDGSGRVQIGNDGLRVFDDDGRWRAIINTYGLIVSDTDNQRQAQIVGGGLLVYDADGKRRAQIGEVDLLTPSTGAETHYPAAVVLYDADGNVIWQEPR